jgi:hypothetical protein
MHGVGRWAAALIAVLAAVSAGPALSDSDDVYVRNSGSVPLSTLRVSPDYSTRWGDDRLGPSQLDPGDEVRVPLPDGDNCFYDVQVGDVTGRSREFWGVDLCNQRTLEVRRSESAPAARKAPADP